MKIIALAYIYQQAKFGDLFSVQIIASHFVNCEVNSSYGSCEVVNHKKNAKENLIDLY